MQINMEFYLVFPLLSSETFPKRLLANSPPFATKKVAARQKSPSDKVLFEREDVGFEVKLVKQTAKVPIAIRADKIKPKPNQKQKLPPANGTVWHP